MGHNPNMRVGTTVLALSSLLLAVQAKISCRDEKGKSTDWFTALKHNVGYDVSYVDAKSHSEFTLSKYPLDQDTNGAIVNTLYQIYDEAEFFYNVTDDSVFRSNITQLFERMDNITRFNNTISELGYAFYNDEHPDGKKSTAYAHSKGVMAFDGKTGFWLTHSMPKWPPTIKKGYDILPDHRYAQSFICITFKTAEFDKIAAQMTINHPWLYDYDISEGLEKKVPAFGEWLDNVKADDDQGIVKLKSEGGVTFTHIGKSKHAGLDLYEDLVAPEIDDDLWVETWQNGGHNLGPFCKNKKKKYDYNVVDIREINMGDKQWRINQDHSKWAVSQDKGGWVCIGDINRQTPQEHRGGGTICQKNAKLHSAFRKIIAVHDEC